MVLHLLSCVGVENDLPYLEHFIRHYERLGIAPENFRLILQTTDPDSPRLRKARDILESHGIAQDHLWSEPYSSRTMWEERRRLQQEIAGPRDWVVSADVDELHEYPAPLEEIVAWCESEGHDIVQGPFIDRLPADGRLSEVPPPAERSLAEACPVQTELRHHIGGHTRNVNLGGSVNLMLIRGDVMPGIGGHNPLPSAKTRDYALGGPLWRFRRLSEPRFLFSMPFLVHHYKWTAGLMERLRERLDHQEMTPAGREYTEKVVAFFDGKGVAMESLPRRDPDRDAPADWKGKVAEMRRRHARMLPMLYAKAALRKAIGR
jgi:hypothetical protein